MLFKFKVIRIISVHWIIAILAFDMLFTNIKHLKTLPPSFTKRLSTFL